MNLGIDIGTSYSSICILNKDGKAEPVYVRTGPSIFGDNYSLPSAVFVENGKISVGQAAMTSRLKAPENFKSEFKRDLGQEIPYTLGNQQFLPQDLYKELFIHLKKCAESYAGQGIDFACITHPANYNDRKKELLKLAAKKAGLLNVTLIDEPTAAAVHYCSDKAVADGSRMLVYDFGGGTFDVALIEYRKNRFEPLTDSLGLEHCGGIDIDHLIFEDIRRQIPSEQIEAMKANQVNVKLFHARLSELSVKAKHHLTETEVFSEYYEVGYESNTYEIERKRLNHMITHLVDETIDCTKRIAENAGLAAGKIDNVLMVGGTSRIPMVREKLEQLTSKILTNVNPELAVSMGAALWTKKGAKSVQPSKQVFCIYCGKKIESNHKFCMYCSKPNASFLNHNSICYAMPIL